MSRVLDGPSFLSFNVEVALRRLLASPTNLGDTTLAQGIQRTEATTQLALPEGSAT